MEETKNTTAPPQAVDGSQSEELIRKEEQEQLQAEDAERRIHEELSKPQVITDPRQPDEAELFERDEQDRKDEEAQQLWTQARTLWDAGRLAESERIFRRLADSARFGGQALYGLGMARLADNDLDEAARNFRKSLERNPANANALYQLGVVAERRESPVEAQAFYRQALTKDPQHAGAMAKLRPAPSSDSVELKAPIGTSPKVSDQGESITKLLQAQNSPESRQALALMDGLRMTVKPRTSWFHTRFLVALPVFLLVLVGAIILLVLPDQNDCVTKRFGCAFWDRGSIRIAFGLLAGDALFAWLVVGSTRLSRTRRITIDDGRIEFERGLFGTKITTVDLWAVGSIELKRSWVDRLTGDGTLFFTGTRYGPSVWLSIRGLARGQQLDDIYHRLRDLSVLLRNNPALRQ